MTIPIVHSAPFACDSTKNLIRLVEGGSDRVQPEYGRMGNPTVTCAERRLAAVERAETAQLFASGMAAITTLFLSSLKPGDHLILTSDCYKRTSDFASTFLKAIGIEVSIVPPTLESIENAVRPATSMVFTETPTNPFLCVIDVERLADLGRRQGVLTVVDSTFATPVNLRPLDYGINLVVHSATKYLGGHNDLLAGVLAGSARLVQPVSSFLATLGGICDPNTAFLLERGLRTLAIRIEKHNANGLTVSEFLQAHSKVEEVYYPGLPSHPQHGVAKQQMSGFGGVVTFLLKADLEGTIRFVDHLEIPRIAPSLGGVESLVEQPAIMSYWKASKEERERAGMTDNLVRLSLGIEDAHDIIADLDAALKQV